MEADKCSICPRKCDVDRNLREGFCKAPWEPVVAVKKAKDKGIKVPFVYNSNGYDSIESLQMMEGLIDIYMPDFKYASNTLGFRYSGVPDYFTVASKALREMYRQVGNPVVDNGLMKSGVLIRHLVMPNLTDDSYLATPNNED